MWLHFLRTLPEPPTVSVDMFEAYAATHAALSRHAARTADLVFMNEEERRLLFAEGLPPHPPVVTKLGRAGATYTSAAGTCRAATDPVARPIDTTGAGEILAGVFLALRLAGLPPVPALREAVRAATAR